MTSYLKMLARLTKQQLKKQSKIKHQEFKAKPNAEAMIKHGTGDYRNKPKQKEFAVDIDTISDEDVTFRIMTMDHIPLEPGRKKNPRNEAETKAKVNFPAFKHYAFQGGELKEVARSHWEGSLSNGKFNPSVGRITNKLGTMLDRKSVV